MQTKRDQARELIKSGRLNDAIKIVKNFDKIYSKDELRVIQIAYECISGNELFYKKIGVNTDETVINAKELLLKMIN